MKRGAVQRHRGVWRGFAKAENCFEKFRDAMAMQ